MTRFERLFEVLDKGIMISYSIIIGLVKCLVKNYFCINYFLILLIRLLAERIFRGV